MIGDISPLLIDKVITNALNEDLGRAGDITTQSIIEEQANATAVLASREDGIICGMELARAAFKKLDDSLDFEVGVGDGEHIKAGEVAARIKGNARAILSAERVALNFLMRMSGIATYTNEFTQEMTGSHAKICCTRKTIPGLRAMDKYAVKCGGGSNHRFGLDDAILIKDNHIAVAGGVKKAIESAQIHVGHLVKIEVEVDTLEQMQEAMEAAPDVILLDNMTPEQLEEAVALKEASSLTNLKLEASGNVNIETVGRIAKTGVDYISTSKITMAAPTLDLGLDIEIS